MFIPLPKIPIIVKTNNLGLFKVRITIKFSYFSVFTPWNEQEMTNRKPETAWKLGKLANLHRTSLGLTFSFILTGQRGFWWLEWFYIYGKMVFYPLIWDKKRYATRCARGHFSKMHFFTSPTYGELTLKGNLLGPAAKLKSNFLFL